MTSPPEAPVYWRERTFTTTEMSVATDVPYDTLNQWLRLMRAMGKTIGERSLGKWAFDAHELYTIHLVAAIYRLGHGINPDVMRAVISFADGGGMSRPDSNLIIPTEDGTAYVAVAARKLWAMTVLNCESVLEAATHV